MKIKVYHAGLMASTILWSNPLLAQINPNEASPPITIIDRNGIDLRGGRLARHHFKISIGNIENPSLVFVAGRTGVASEIGTASGGHVEAIRCDRSTYNYCYMWRYVVFGTYAEWHKRESTDSSRFISSTGQVYETGDNGGHLTLSDGTVVTYDNSRISVPPCTQDPCEGPKEYTYEIFASALKPDGEQVTSNFTIVNGTGKSVVRTTTGYAALEEGGPSVTTSYKTKLYNLTTATCNNNSICVSDENNLPNFESSSGFGFIDCISCVITDAMGKSASKSVTELPGDSSSSTVNFVTRSGKEYSNTIKGYWNGFFQGVSAFSEAGHTTTYDYKFDPTSNAYSPVLGGASAKYPNGDIFSYRLSADGGYFTRYNGGPETYISFMGNLSPYGNAGDSSKIRQITYPEGNGVKYGYDNRGNMSSMTIFAKPNSGQRDLISIASYPITCGNPKTCNKPEYIIDQSGNRTDFTYDSTHGGVIKEELPADKNGNRSTTHYVYQQISARYHDELGNLVSGPPIWKLKSKSICSNQASCFGSKDQTIISYAYNDNLLVISEKSSSGDNSIISEIKKEYDNIGNVISITGPSVAYSDRTMFFYDMNRRLVKEIRPNPNHSNTAGVIIKLYSYDDDDQIEKIEFRQAVSSSKIDADASKLIKTKSYSYDGAGRKVREITASANGEIMRIDTGYDTIGRISCINTRMAGNLSDKSTDACTATSDEKNGYDRITKTIYNDQGNISQIQKAYDTPLMQTYVAYQYSSNGLRTSVTDANGNRAEMRYDGFDRQSAWYFPSKATAGAASTDDYEAYGYDANGNRTSLRKRDGRQLTFEYDALNRMTVKRVPKGCAPAQSGDCPEGSATRDVYYGYDLRGLQTYARFDNAASESVTNAYDGLGRLTSSTITMADTSRTVTAEYDAGGNRTQLTTPRGSWTYTYDAASRMTGLYEGVGTSTVMSNWEYNAQGLPKKVTERFGSGASWGYDGIGRLTDQNDTFAGGTGNVAVTLGYNPASQIVSRTRNNQDYAFAGKYEVTRKYEKNGLNQYTTAGPATFSYDANGNLIADGKTTYVYDAENRLVKAGETSLTYDPLGRLFQVSGSSGSTQFLYDGDQLVAEYDGAGGLTNAYVHGPGEDDPLLWYPAGEAARWYHRDHQGSIVATASGPSGTLAGINTYDEYGIPGAGNRGRFQYTGQAFIPELGMYHYKARVYSPTLGRFLQTDPIGYDDQINLYAYVGNDPVNGRDPTGTSCEAPTGSRICTTATAATAVAAREGIGAERARSGYREATGRLAPNDSAGRSAAKATARAETPPITRGVVEGLRPGLGPKSGSGGTANRTNAGADRLAGRLGTAGRVAGVAGVAVGVARIATSDNPGQEAARVGGGMTGAIAGTEAGAAVGAFGGPWGAVAGGVVGGIVGGFAGEKAVDNLLDWDRQPE